MVKKTAKVVKEKREVKKADRPPEFLPDGVFDVPRAEGDEQKQDMDEVLVKFHTYVRVGRNRDIGGDLEFQAGSTHTIPAYLADSLHRSCDVIGGD